MIYRRHGHKSPEFAAAFHDASGWAALFLAFGLVNRVARLLLWAYPPARRTEEQPPPAARMMANPAAAKSRGLAAACTILSLLMLGAMLADRRTMPLLERARREYLDPPHAYHRYVRDAAAALPESIDGWRSKDLPVPVEVTSALRPNLIINREYVSGATGRRAALLLVHTLDVGDAQHPAQACYGVRGWEPTDARPRDWRIAGLEIHGTAYAFERIEGGQPSGLGDC